MLRASARRSALAAVATRRASAATSTWQRSSSAQEPAVVGPSEMSVGCVIVGGEDLAGLRSGGLSPQVSRATADESRAVVTGVERLRPRFPSRRATRVVTALPPDEVIRTRRTAMPRPDPRQDPRAAPDPSFLGEQSQGGTGNHAGPEPTLARLLSWWLGRKDGRNTREAIEARARKARLKAERKVEKRSR